MLSESFGDAVGDAAWLALRNSFESVGGAVGNAAWLALRNSFERAGEKLRAWLVPGSHCSPNDSPMGSLAAKDSFPGSPCPSTTKSNDSGSPGPPDSPSPQSRIFTGFLVGVGMLRRAGDSLTSK